MNKRAWRSITGVLFVSMLLTIPAMADNYSVYVGYADGLRGSGFFPNPWAGDAGVTFLGTTVPGADAGAIMIVNNAATALTVSDITVAINGTGLGDIWSTSLPVTLASGDRLIVTETFHYNFDTSDIHFVPGAGPGSPCTGSISDPPACATTFPTVSITTGGGTNNYNDTGHVLDTEGFDFASVGNESHQWRPIGTFGGQAGGEVPEPASVVLFGTLALATLWSRRKSFAKMK